MPKNSKNLSDPLFKYIRVKNTKVVTTIQKIASRMQIMARGNDHFFSMTLNISHSIPIAMPKTVMEIKIVTSTLFECDISSPII